MTSLLQVLWKMNYSLGFYNRFTIQQCWEIQLCCHWSCLLLYPTWVASWDLKMQVNIWTQLSACLDWLHHIWMFSQKSRCCSTKSHTTRQREYMFVGKVLLLSVLFCSSFPLVCILQLYSAPHSTHAVQVLVLTTIGQLHRLLGLVFAGTSPFCILILV